MPQSPSGAITTGTEEPRPHLHLIEGTRVCRSCKQEKPLARFIVRKDRPDYAYPDCRDCNNAKRARVNAARAKPPEEKWLKKLPPYPVLRHMYLQQGKTVTQIAKHYDASRTSVWNKMRFWAPRFGDPWPLPLPDRSRRLSEGMTRRSVRSELIIDLVYDHVAEHPIFVVDGNGECVPRRQTLKEWANRAGVQHSWLSKTRSTKCRISKPMAITLLLALGEEPNADLYEKSYRESPKYSGNYHRYGNRQFGQTAS